MEDKNKSWLANLRAIEGGADFFVTGDSQMVDGLDTNYIPAGGGV